MNNNTYPNLIENNIVEPNDPLFSIIIPYRNRPVETIQRCLESLNHQSLAPREIIVVDYGSTKDCSDQVKYICKNIQYCKYIYTDTRGYFWSRGEALNLGLKYSEGQIVAVLDSDLIVPGDFLKTLHKRAKKNHFLIYPVIYLNETFDQYEKLYKGFEFHSLESSTFSATGNIVAFREDLIKLNGYNPYFRIWGGEDINLANRLESAGIQQENIDKTELHVFHQWHNRSMTHMPKGWISVFSQKNQSPDLLTQVKNLEEYELKDLNQRPALVNYLEGRSNDQKIFTFDFPIEQSFAKFLIEFNNLTSNQCMAVHQDFNRIQASPNSKLGNLMQKVNRMLQKLRISYRISDIHTFETEYIDFQKVYAFIFYFILHNDKMIEDYYLNIDPQKELIECLIIKK